MSASRGCAALVLLAACATLPGAAAAQRWTLGTDVQAEVDEVFAFVGRDDPGCALGVVRDGQLAYGRGYGLANLDWGIPLSTSTVFDIGSVSKQFTASALALLDMDGVLSLDDEARTWIPELPDYGRPLTIRHMLNHTSGIRDYLTLMRLAGHDYDNVFDEFDGVEMIVRQKDLNFPPGQEFLYSNSGYLLLANIVRRASGQSVREYLQERVFDPLGMAHTSIWDQNTEIVQRRATGYSGSAGAWSIDHAWNFQMGGDGQVLTSVDDLVRWDRNFYDPAVGGRGLLDRLHTRGVLDSGDTIPYALGLTLDEYRGVRRVQHGGAWAGFRAMLTRYPDHRTSVIVLCNRGDANTNRYADGVADAVLADHLEARDDAGGPGAAPGPGPQAEPIQLTPAQLRRWEGAYRGSGNFALAIIELRNGRLHLQVQGEDLPLEPLSETDFHVTVVDAPLAFAMEGAEATVSFAGQTLTRFERAQPSTAELASYAGRYHSEELDATWVLSVADGELVATLPGQDPVTLVALGRDEFSAEGTTLTFQRSGSRIIAVSANAGRVTGIVFVREGS